MNARCLTGALVAFLLATPAFAASSVVVNHEGRLLDGNDTPVNGTVDLKVALYDAATAGEAVFSDTWSALPVTNGVYSILLGDTGHAPLDAGLFATDLWLQVTVNGTDLLPRRRLGVVPVAARALDAGSLGGKTLADLDARYDAKYAPLAGASGYAQLSPSAAQSGSLAVTGTVTSGGFTTTGEVRAGSVTATSFIGDGAGLENLPAANLSGTVPESALKGSYAIDISGTAASALVAQNGLVSTGAYADPAWLTALSASKLTGTVDPARIGDGSIPAGKLATDANGVVKGLAAEKVGTLDASALATSTAMTSAIASALATMTGATRGCTTSAGASGTQTFDGKAWGTCSATPWNCTLAPSHPGCVSSSAYPNCKAILADPNFVPTDGLYWIDPDGVAANAFQAYCDMTGDTGGWTLVMRTWYVGGSTPCPGISGCAAMMDNSGPVNASALLGRNTHQNGKFSDLGINLIRGATGEYRWSNEFDGRRTVSVFAPAASFVAPSLTARSVMFTTAWFGYPRNGSGHPWGYHTAASWGGWESPDWGEGQMGYSASIPWTAASSATRDSTDYWAARTDGICNYSLGNAPCTNFGISIWVK